MLDDLCRHCGTFSFAFVVLHGTITGRSTLLHPIAVDARRTFSSQRSVTSSSSSVKVYVFDVECVDVARDVAQNCQAYIYEEVHAASRYQEDAHRWDEDGDENDKEGGSGVAGHCGVFVNGLML